MEIVGLQVQRERVGEQVRQAFSDLLAVLVADADVDPGSVILPDHVPDSLFNESEQRKRIGLPAY
ncbi:hypothetical protein [Burkholderia sp. LMG 32019]|uniref:hypothetical protein n=1 Tax=Burkholderia sp. LMG 32019 TaxID=3158173 RepID=UPI003C2DC001